MSRKGPVLALKTLIPERVEFAGNFAGSSLKRGPVARPTKNFCEAEKPGRKENSALSPDFISRSGCKVRARYYTEVQCRGRRPQKSSTCPRKEGIPCLSRRSDHRSLAIRQPSGQRASRASWEIGGGAHGPRRGEAVSRFSGSTCLSSGPRGPIWRHSWPVVSHDPRSNPIQLSHLGACMPASQSGIRPSSAGKPVPVTQTLHL